MLCRKILRDCEMGLQLYRLFSDYVKRGNACIGRKVSVDISSVLFQSEKLVVRLRCFFFTNGGMSPFVCSEAASTSVDVISSSYMDKRNVRCRSNQQLSLNTFQSALFITPKNKAQKLSTGISEISATSVSYYGMGVVKSVLVQVCDYIAQSLIVVNEPVVKSEFFRNFVVLSFFISLRFDDYRKVRFFFLPRLLHPVWQQGFHKKILLEWNEKKIFVSESKMGHEQSFGSDNCGKSVALRSSVNGCILLTLCFICVSLLVHTAG